MSHRPDQIASLIQRAVQSVLERDLNDPRVRGLVSVTRVRVDHDLRHADVHLSVLPAERASLTMEGIRHAAAAIQSRVGKAVRLRRVPRLTFHLDESIKKQAEFEAALAENRQRHSREPDS